MVLGIGEMEEDDEDFLDHAFQHVRCINLKRRPDRWQAFTSQAFVPRKVQRFNAIDGNTLLTVSEEDCQVEWDATNNAKYDSHIQPPFNKICTMGEVGCTLSHVALWKELVSKFKCNGDSYDNRSEAMLILEDDAIFHPSFLTSFAEMYKLVPKDWDVFYLGFCNAGSTTLIAQKQVVRQSSIKTISIVKPSYGFYTHAYAIRSKGAIKLLSQLPIEGPIDTWLADNDWFSLKVYYGMMGKSTCIVGQRRNDLKNDIAHSAHHSRPSSS